MKYRKQISLYEEEESNVIKNEETGGIKRIVDKKYTKEHCFKRIKEEQYLWDMRAWENYKDHNEVEEWILAIKEGKGSCKNCSNIVYCIGILLDMDTPINEIVDAVMENPHIQYKNRLVRCFHDGSKCPHWTIKNGFANCPCEKCE